MIMYNHTYFIIQINTGYVSIYYYKCRDNLCIYICCEKRVWNYMTRRYLKIKYPCCFAKYSRISFDWISPLAIGTFGGLHAAKNSHQCLLYMCLCSFQSPLALEQNSQLLAKRLGHGPWLIFIYIYGN